MIGSRMEEVLTYILGKGELTSKLFGRIERLLLTIHEGGEWEEETHSRVEDILVAILNGERYEEETHSRIEEILKAKANGETFEHQEYADLSRIEALLLEWLEDAGRTISGSLPLTFKTSSNTLLDYKIYGNTVNEEGVGVKTENLFDEDDPPLYPLGYYLNSRGVATKSESATKWYITNYIKVKELTTYYLIGITIGTSYGSYTCFYDSNKNFIGSQETRNSKNKKVTTPQGCAYMCVSRESQLRTMVIMGDEIPSNYIPYGYKLPMISRTENFFDYSSTETGYRIQWANGRPYADATAIMSDYIPVTEGDYVLNTGVVVVGYATDKSYVGVYRSDKTWKKQSSELFSAFTVLSSSNVKFVKLMTYDGYGSITNTLMLTEGSTPPNTYIPYHRTETPIYIGDPIMCIPDTDYADYVDYKKGKIVRQIKKLVLTGDEYIRTYGIDKHSFEVVTQDTDLPVVSSDTTYPGISNRGVVTYRSRFYNKTPSPNIEYVAFGVVSKVVALYEPEYSTSNDLKTFLADQYAAGTPVTIWYVLETPVEENPPVPLPQLPTFTDADTVIDYEETPAPEEVELTYKP